MEPFLLNERGIMQDFFSKHEEINLTLYSKRFMNFNTNDKRI